MNYSSFVKKYKLSIIAAVVVAVVVVISITMVLRSRVTPVEVITKPTVVFRDAEKILKPSVSIIENYQIFKAEYALGSSTSDNIDLKINWTNGGGFEINDVNSLIFKRKLKNREGDISPDMIIGDTGGMLTDFADGTVLFKGIDLFTDENGVGDNMIHMYYTTDKITVPQLIGVTEPISVTQGDLDTTLNINEIIVMSVPVTTSGDGSVAGQISKNSQYTLYTIKSVSPGFTSNGLRLKVLDDDKRVQILNSDGTGRGDWAGTGTDTFIFRKFMGSYMIIKGNIVGQGGIQQVWMKGSNGNIISSGDTNVFNSQSTLRDALFDITTDDTESSGTGSGAPDSSGTSSSGGSS
jgi:hypothetical protein